MEISMFKKRKQSNFSQLQDVTTQVTSKKHSRKSSFNTTVSKDCQQSKKIQNPSLIFQNHKESKKYITVTSRRRVNSVLDQKSIEQWKKTTFLKFKFCQQIPIYEGFYLQNQIISQLQQRQLQQRHPVKLGKIRQQKAFPQKFINADRLQSPIHKLMQLQMELQNHNIQPKQFKII